MSFLRSAASRIDKGSTPHKVTRVGRGWKLGGLFLVLVVGLYSTHPYYLSALGRFLIVSDSLAKADAIIVLAGGAPRDERLLHAMSLWQRGYAPRIVLSAKLADWQSHEDFPSWRHAKKLNILPAGSLLVAAHKADSTKEEAQRLLPFMHENGYKSVIIVTSNYHTRRAKLTFAKQWAGEGIVLRISAAPSSKFHPEDWWTHRTDSRTFYFEFSKTVWYALME